MATITLYIQQVEDSRDSTLLSILKDHNIKVKQFCGGQGMCASCHLFIIDGATALTPPTPEEQKTFQFTKIDRPGARLACQTHLIGDGVAIQLPRGIFVKSEQDLERDIGKKAQKTLLHPLTGEVLVEAGKLILRSAVEKMQQSSGKFANNLSLN
jgi:ferredoxin